MTQEPGSDHHKGVCLGGGIRSHIRSPTKAFRSRLNGKHVQKEGYNGESNGESIICSSVSVSASAPFAVSFRCSRM